MPIPYAERKKRRQALLQRLPPDLPERLALRHVEAVARLPAEAQRTLAGALGAGLRETSAAVAVLQREPQASIETVLGACRDARKGESAPLSAQIMRPAPPSNADPDAVGELSRLLEGCFPAMPAMTARALAEDALLSEALALLQAWRACLRSGGVSSELVYVVLCALALRFACDLSGLLASCPRYRPALAQSSLDAGRLLAGEDGPAAGRPDGNQPLPGR